MMYMPPQSLTDDILPNHYEKARMVGGEYIYIRLDTFHLL